MFIASLGTSSPRFNKTSTSAINSLPFCDAVGDNLSKCILSNSLLISSTSSSWTMHHFCPIVQLKIPPNLSTGWHYDILLFKCNVFLQLSQEKMVVHCLSPIGCICPFLHKGHCTFSPFLILFTISIVLSIYIKSSPF